MIIFSQIILLGKQDRKCGEGYGLYVKERFCLTSTGKESNHIVLMLRLQMAM